MVRWHGVAVWKWDVNEDVCGICRLAFDACCPDCTVPGDNCSPGKCVVLLFVATGNNRNNDVEVM